MPSLRLATERPKTFAVTHATGVTVVKLTTSAASSFVSHADLQAAAAARGITCVLSVTTPSEFVLATKLHVARVRLLAAELRRRYPDEFAQVDPDVLDAFASLHDAAKTNDTPEFLSEHGLDKPLADDLVVHWGRRIKATETATHPLVDKVNRVDAKVSQRFFAERQIPPDLAELYEFLVEVADKVDRGSAPLSRYEEMGKTAVAVSEYLLDATDERSVRLIRYARELEADYHQLIPEALDYLNVRGRR